MTKTNTRSRIVSILLVLMMLLTMLPITALAASPDASNVFVDGGKNFYNPGRLYYKNNDPENAFTGTSTDFNAAYDPATGTLTLKDYNGKGITVGGVECSDITVVLKGTNTINGSLTNDVGGDITITSESGGTLSITNTLSGGKAIGIETGLSASYTTGNVTIKGDAKVTINMTNNGMSTYEKAYGIYAKKNITISENASVDITCATPNNTTGGDNCNGLYAAKDVTIDTNGTIKIDVTKAGKDNGYSFGVYPMGTATLTKVGEMEVQWKKHATHSSYPGGAVYKGASLSDTDYAINEDTTNCYASYRFGTPRTVMVQDGQLTGPGVKYAKNSGYFLAGDNVNITPATKKGRSGEEIPFKEWTSSDVMLDKSATTASNSFTVPGKDVTVTAKHSPFVGTPTFTPTGTTGTEGTLTFKTVVKADGAYEGFRLVKEGNENNESSYIRINPGTTSTSSPYEYSCETNIYELDKGNYYVVAYLNNDYYLGEKFTVNYTAPVTTYTVSFDANGGTGTMADVTGISGEYTLPANGFTAPDGKQFKAWSVSGTEKAVGDKITVTANTTVTAIWEAVEYNVTVTGGTASVGAGTPITKATMGPTVTFDANGGTGSMAAASGVSGDYVLPVCGFTAPNGKQFKAWSVGGVEKAVGDKITVTADTTVTAIWEDIPATLYTITFNANGGSVTPETATTTADGKLTSLPTPTRSGSYTFKSWYTASSGGTQVTTDTVFNADITIYAQWTYTGGGGGRSTSRYTVSFESNGGSKVANQTVTRNSVMKEPTAPTKENFDFDGWYSDKELKTKYDFSAKVTKSFTLYAKWTEKDNSINQIILTLGKKDAQVFGKTKSNDVAPKIVNDRTMLPARFVAENLGAKVEWDGEKELVTITSKNLKTDENVTILITIGAATVKVNGKEIKLDSPAFIENDRTYTPIRFISENLGASVEWVEKEQKVIITKPEIKKAETK